MKVAIVCAGFTAGEADALRRSMATFKFTGGVSKFKDKLVQGMVKNGYTEEFAEKTFSQLEGFGSYGFPESHAASFALIAYASSYLKCHYPDVFCAALINAQPMGFYAPAQIVTAARAHGVAIRPICINHSRWDCTLEEIKGTDGHAVRHDDRNLEFGVEGGEVLGLDNGALDAYSRLQEKRSRPTHHGRCLAILKAGTNPGVLKLSVGAQGLPDNTTVIRIEP